MLINKTNMEDYVSFEQAQKLKELGFDWETWTFYYTKLPDDGVHTNEMFADHNESLIDTTSAPTLAQAAKWLREKGIEVNAIFNSIERNWFWYYKSLEALSEEVFDSSYFDTYEQALSAGIDKALKLLKE